MNKIISTLIGLILFFPSAVLAQGVDTELGTVNSFAEYVSLIWNYGAQILLALAVFFIVLGAFFYVASAGNDEKVSQGKQMIMGSLIAVFIVISSGVLIRTLHKPVAGSSGYLTDIPNVINNATSILTGLIGSFSVAMLVYAGYLYATAGGDEERTNRARRAIQYAIFGLMIGLLGFVIIRNVVNYFI